MSSNWAKDFNLQPKSQTIKDLSYAQDQFANQEQHSKNLQKNLENLFQDSAKLRKKTESLAASLQQSIPKAHSSLAQIKAPTGAILSSPSTPTFSPQTRKRRTNSSSTVASNATSTTQ
ncbi:uncharacterized protein SAPINGB_P005487 [Magnusiomyces paraingens]|uniref:Uncharacterized protein n=1 Tax=Magnusiomyces paraingens TaxID=2606893 RepID=A0A5E8C733_9ASCO|nr:uncharacterized protein SAPINGB_P005487 [Saprochaete ingens]VVT57006.1 unnamed protein product [Saprochaete ingens]